MTSEQRTTITNHASDALALVRAVLPRTADGVQAVFDSGLQSSNVDDRLPEDDAHELRDVIRVEPRAVLNAIQQALEEPGRVSTPASRAVGTLIDSLPTHGVRSTRDRTDRWSLVVAVAALVVATGFQTCAVRERQSTQSAEVIMDLMDRLTDFGRRVHGSGGESFARARAYELVHMSLMIETFLDGPAKAVNFSDDSLRGMLSDPIQLVLAYPPLCDEKKGSENAYKVLVRKGYPATAALFKETDFCTCSVSHGAAREDTPESEPVVRTAREESRDS